MEQSTCTNYSAKCKNMYNIPDILQYGVGYSNASSRDIELHINLFLSIAIMIITNAKLIM